MIIRQQVQQVKPSAATQVASIYEIIEARELVKQVYMDEKIEQYIVDIVFASRYPDQHNLVKLKGL